MTDGNLQDAPKRIGADKIILGLLAVLILGALFYISNQRQQVLRSSPAGMDGLQIWLSRNDIDVQSFAGGWPLNADEIGLQIIPLYDTDLDNRRVLPETQQDLLLQQDEYDLEGFEVREKAEMVPTLVVLPKWRTGMRLTGLAHPLLLAERERVATTADALIAEGNINIFDVRQPFTGFTYSSFDGDPQEAVIYAAQTLVAPQCQPVIGDESAMLLAKCPLDPASSKTDVFVLSDPDLLNNHGLLLGDNAHVMRDWVGRQAGDARVIIDYSRENWLTEDVTASQRDRTWADLLRFFSPPFTLMWAGLVLAIALTLWRAAVRFGPLLKGPNLMSASKMMAIGARAKLMRLSNRDGSLAVEYSRARLATTATALFGAAHARQLSRPEAFLAYTKRRHPEHAADLTTALNVIEALPDHASPAQAMASVADLDRILETIKNDT
ncbi:MAG: hypothetical protein AAFP98_06320 [Pseudomonadota bacterium]